MDEHVPTYSVGAGLNLKSYRKIDSEQSFLTGSRDVLFWTAPVSGPGPPTTGAWMLQLKIKL